MDDSDKEKSGILYNGIELHDRWPPREPLSREPMPLPYIENPPQIIPIDVGRQLFVDDFLIENTTLRRTFHRAEYHPFNPVIEPEKPWETAGKSTMAYAYSGGAWYDPTDKLFKLWYSAGLCVPEIKGYGTYYLCIATSTDGVHWEKPDISHIKPDSNIVLQTHHDSTTVWLDHRDPDPSRRFKYFGTERGEDWQGWALVLRTSPDGIRWSDPVVAQSIYGDRATCFYNPFRSVWVVSARIDHHLLVRSRGYVEHAIPESAIAGIPAKNFESPTGEAVPWCTSDKFDPHNPIEEYSDLEPQLYNLDAAPYESLMLGLFSIWQGPENAIVRDRGIQKRCDVLIGFSRDGFHWARPDHGRFISADEQEGAWNWGNIQSAGGGCLVVGDKLYFYVSARPKDPTGMHGRANTGLAIIRRDGFASLDGDAQGGTITTRQVKFSGKYLFVNVGSQRGDLRVEVLDLEGRIIEPFTVNNCRPVSVDSTLHQVTWNGTDDMSVLTGKPVKFRFHLRSGNLYSFWVTSDGSGASHGYVAGGGPGFIGEMDTVGATNAGSRGSCVALASACDPQWFSQKLIPKCFSAI